MHKDKWVKCSNCQVSHTKDRSVETCGIHFKYCNNATDNYTKVGGVSMIRIDQKRQEIADALKLDSLAEAEKITKKSYKEDEMTGMLGFALHMQHVKDVNKLMEESGDTKFSENVKDYLRKVKEFGFEVVYEEDFINTHDDITPEKQYIMWHEKYSLLLVFDTFHGSRNGGSVYYNWTPNDNTKRHNLTSSGGMVESCMKYDFSGIVPFEEPSPKWEDGIKWDDYCKLNDEWRDRFHDHVDKNKLVSVWSGNHDCREALKFNMTGLAENGRFLKKWIDRPFLWLCHYADTKVEGYSYEAINAEKIAKLPEHVRKAITPDEK